MQSYKTGHLLRASPRAQFIASLCGCVVGVWASVAGEWDSCLPVSCVLIVIVITVALHGVMRFTC